MFQEGGRPRRRPGCEPSESLPTKEDVFQFHDRRLITGTLARPSHIRVASLEQHLGPGGAGGTHPSQYLRAGHIDVIMYPTHNPSPYCVTFPKTLLSDIIRVSVE